MCYFLILNLFVNISKKLLVIFTINHTCKYRYSLKSYWKHTYLDHINILKTCLKTFAIKHILYMHIDTEKQADYLKNMTDKQSWFKSGWSSLNVTVDDYKLTFHHHKWGRIWKFKDDFLNLMETIVALKSILFVPIFSLEK